MKTERNYEDTNSSAGGEGPKLSRNDEASFPKTYTIDRYWDLPVSNHSPRDQPDTVKDSGFQLTMTIDLRRQVRLVRPSIRQRRPTYHNNKS